MRLTYLGPHTQTFSIGQLEPGDEIDVPGALAESFGRRPDFDGWEPPEAEPAEEAHAEAAATDAAVVTTGGTSVTQEQPRAASTTSNTNETEESADGEPDD